MKKRFIVLLVSFLIISCENGKKSDAYGNFEATEVLISAETTGKLISFTIDEGRNMKAGEKIGVVDTIQLYLKKQQIVFQRKAISSKTENILSQIKIYEEQLKTLHIEKKRLDNLFKDGAATQQQLDNINGQIHVVEKQIESIKTQNISVFSELDAYTKQIEQLQDQIQKSIIINPIDGIVLRKYAEQNEIALTGKSLYKIADISTLQLRVYVSGKQLPSIKPGQKVEVLVDLNEKENQKFEGEVFWISDQVEFTPKIIQTKEERVNMVYAVKVRVKNNGSLKIGMPGEVNFR